MSSWKKKGVVCKETSVVQGRSRRGRWHARLGIVGYKVLPSFLDPEGVPILGMVARGAKYPYSSVRQDERNRRRYGTEGLGRALARRLRGETGTIIVDDPHEVGEEWFKNARFIDGRGSAA